MNLQLLAGTLLHEITSRTPRDYFVTLNGMEMVQWLQMLAYGRLMGEETAELTLEKCRCLIPDTKLSYTLCVRQGSDGKPRVVFIPGTDKARLEVVLPMPVFDLTAAARLLVANVEPSVASVHALHEWLSAMPAVRGNQVVSRVESALLEALE